MIYYDYLTPCYHRQKSYYNKAYFSVTDSNEIKTYTLFSDVLNKGFTVVAKIMIDKKHASKNRYAITSDNIDAVTYKHITDFIQQFYKHKTTLTKITRRGHVIKDKLFQYALELN